MVPFQITKGGDEGHFSAVLRLVKTLKKIINSEYVNQNELILVFSKIVSKGLCCDIVWEISIFPSCTPMSGLQTDALKVIPLFCTAHNFATSNTVKILAGRLNRLRKTAFVVNKNLSPAKTTFNCKNGRKIQTRPSLFAKIDPLRLKLFFIVLLQINEHGDPPFFICYLDILSILSY